MARRVYIWGWPYIILILVTLLVRYSIVLWHHLIAHFVYFQRFDSIFGSYWSITILWLWRAVWICTILLALWYVFDWLQGYAVLDFFSYQLRSFLLRSINDNILDASSQRQANRYIKSIKMRYCWRSPHLVIVTIRLPNNQTVAKIVRNRIISGLGDDEISAISWLNLRKFWLLRNRHWELDQSSSHYIKLIGRKN